MDILHNTYPLFTWPSVDFLLTTYPPLFVHVFIECSLIDILIAWWSRWIWGIYGWGSYGRLWRLVWAKICQKSRGWYDERRWGRNGVFCNSQQRKMGWKHYGKGNKDSEITLKGPSFPWFGESWHVSGFHMRWTAEPLWNNENKCCMNELKFWEVSRNPKPSKFWKFQLAQFPESSGEKKLQNEV